MTMFWGEKKTTTMFWILSLRNTITTFVLRQHHLVLDPLALFWILLAGSFESSWLWILLASG
jgi:hypothetical protein